MREDVLSLDHFTPLQGIFYSSLEICLTLLTYHFNPRCSHHYALVMSPALSRDRHSHCEDNGSARVWQPIVPIRDKQGIFQVYSLLDGPYQVCGGIRTIYFPCHHRVSLFRQCLSHGNNSSETGISFQHGICPGQYRVLGMGK